jgi:NAD(P)-dependent dehydrogenase (short-subunit alcohol dehydrogenase family)
LNISADSSLATQPAAGRLRGGALNGKVAVVTGAAKGMGGQICQALAGDGADLVLAARDTQALDALALSLAQLFPDRRTLVVGCDVTDSGSVAAMIAQTTESFASIDILVNAAGVTGPVETAAEDVTAEEFRAVLDINVVGTFLCCAAVIPFMKAQRSGRIINIAGTSGLRGYRNRAAYSSSKWAVRGLTRTLALELGPYGVTVNDICPNVTNGNRMDGIIATKARRLGVTPEEVRREFASQTALGRFIDESDVAEAVRFLVCDSARNITGQDLVVDAGWNV